MSEFIQPSNLIEELARARMEGVIEGLTIAKKILLVSFDEMESLIDKVKRIDSNG